MKRLLEHLELQFPLDSAGLLYTFSLGSTLGWISCGPQCSVFRMGMEEETESREEPLLLRTCSTRDLYPCTIWSHWEVKITMSIMIEKVYYWKTIHKYGRR